MNKGLVETLEDLQYSVADKQIRIHDALHILDDIAESYPLSGIDTQQLYNELCWVLNISISKELRRLNEESKE